jgi:trans-aconitate 2-methyltransferase
LTPGPREWDAEEYESLARPQDAWGLRILGMLDLKGDETVLEAGCGTGRDTERLLKLLPHGRVIALDGSARMLELLTRRLAGKLDRVDVIQADLAAPLELPSPVDVVFSVAAFHWIQDHAALFRNLATVLRRGGRLVADCGGFGNVAQVSAAVEQVTGRPGEEGVWNFAHPDETRRILEESGFSNVKVHLHSEPAEFLEGREFERYLHSVVLGSHLARMPFAQHAEFVRSVAALLPDRRVDYVRLTISASR